MKTALCEADLKRDRLCKDCQQKLDSNEITALDIKVSRLLNKLEKNFSFRGIEFNKALELGDMIILSCSGTIGVLIGRKGKIVSELTKALGKKTRIIEKTGNEKKMIQDMIGNARLIGLNKIFKPEETEYKVIISKTDQNKLIGGDPKQLEKGLKELFNAKTTIEFR